MRGAAEGPGETVGLAAASVSIGFMAIPFDASDHRNPTVGSQEQKENSVIRF
jgi:hypothetical protein